MSEQNEQESAELKAARWIGKNRGAEAARAFMRKQLAQACAELNATLKDFEESCRKLEDVNNAAADSVRAELKGLIP